MPPDNFVLCMPKKTLQLLFGAGFVNHFFKKLLSVAYLPDDITGNNDWVTAFRARLVGAPCIKMSAGIELVHNVNRRRPPLIQTRLAN